MALGDILAGLSEAGHQHRTNLLQMDYEQRKDLADKYFQVSQDPRYPSDIQSEALKRSVGLHTTQDLGKKIPKEISDMTFTVQPPTPPNITTQDTTQPGDTGPTAGMVSAGTGASAGTSALPSVGVQSQSLQPPTPPPQTVTMAPRSFESELARQRQSAMQAGDIKTDVELRDFQRRHDFLKQQLPDLPEVQLAALVMGHAPPTMSFAMPGTISGIDAKTLASLDAGGQPVQDSAHYNARMMNGNWVLTPTEIKTPALKFAQNDQGKWVGYTMDPFTKKVSIQQDLGLTPPQGLPTTSISHDVRVMPTPDGGFEEVPITQSTTRTRGSGGNGIAAPTPPPGTQVAPTTPTASKATPTPGTAPRTPTGNIPGAGRSFTPEQVMQTQQKAEAYSNTIDRMTGVLDRVDDPKFNFASFLKRAKLSIASNPDGTAKLVIANTASLSDDEAKFAADYVSLGEDINVLRSIYNATGFRGPEALQLLLGQRGNLLGNPAVFKQVLGNSLQSITSQLKPIQTQLSRARQPIALTDGILKAYLRLNGNDETKAVAALKRDGWQVK